MNLLQRFKIPNEVCSIHIELTDEGMSTAYLVQLKQQKNKIQIAEKHTIVFKPEKLKEVLSDKAPIVIALTGKGILHKRLKYSEGDDDKYLLNQLLTGADIHEFYLQKTISENQWCFVSAVRKQLIEKICTAFQEHEKQIIGFVFGSFSALNLLPFLPDNTDLIQAGKYELHITNGQLTDHVKATDVSVEPVTISEEKIEGEYLLPFAAGLSVYVGSPSEVNMDFLTVHEEELYHKNIFNLLLKGSLAALFLVLMVNFLLFNQFYKENGNLKSALSGSKENLDKLKSLQEDVSQKEMFLKRAGWLEASKTSFYADRIAATLPKELHLKELYVYPADKEKNRLEQNQVAFLHEQIVIKGVTNKNTVINNWIDELKQQQWLRSVKIVNYQYDNQNLEGGFEVMILL